MEFNSNFILGCSAIGAGLAVILVSDLVLVRVSQQDSSSSSRKKSGSKIRYYIYHASWTGSCRETTGLYGLLVAMLLLFVKPLVP